MNITIVILTFNEEIHIRRCLESIGGLNANILIIDSFSSDSTCEIAKAFGARVIKNVFVNQAQQFQWGVDASPFNDEWVLRLDADETLDEDLIHNIRMFVLADGNGSNGGVFHRKHIFLGKWIRYGGRYPLPMLRLFRSGKAHVEQRWMDEHIVLDEGASCIIEGGFEDNNLNSVSWFVDKHNKYASREMIDVMLKRIRPCEESKITEGTGLAIRTKRFLKQSIYMRLPYFVRPFLYFCFRYFFQLGFLDGAKGFAYHFMQGFWYRCLVDLKCLEAEGEMAKVVTVDEKIRVLELLSGYKLSSNS